MKAVLFLFLLVPAWLCAQKNTSFRVVDEKTGEPISYCYALLKGKSTSAVSSENGVINIALRPSDTVVVSQLGYFLKKTTLAEIEKNGMKVFLKAKTISLDEVTVSAHQRDTFLNRIFSTCIAFEFYDDYILALTNKGGKYNSLLLLDTDGNRISEKKLSIRSQTMVKDCFGNIHLLTADSIFQVYYNYQHLRLLRPFPASDWNRLLQPCQCFLGPRYVFKQKAYRQLKNNYYLYDENKKQQQELFVSVADSDAIRSFNTDYDINYFLSQRRQGFGYATSVGELKKNIDQLREELVLPADYTNLMRPVESEIKKCDTGFVLFDYTNKVRQLHLADGSFLQRDTLTGWSDINPAVCIDHDLGTFIFSSLSKKGILTLFLYDVKSNRFTHSCELKDFYFVKSFRIKNNRLYFIYKDRKEEISQGKIIKVSVDWKANDQK